MAITTTWFYCPKDNEPKTCVVTLLLRLRLLWADPGQKISCGLAQTGLAVLVSSGLHKFCHL